MKHLIPAVTLLALFYGIGKCASLIESSAAFASPPPGPYPSFDIGATPFALEPDRLTHTYPSVTTGSAPGAPKKPAVPGKKWVRRTFKGAETAEWIQVWDKPAVPKTGPAATAPRGSEIVGDHWHWPNDYMTVLHGERWGRAGRLGSWKTKVKVRKVP